MKGKVVLAMGKVAESDKADRQAEEPPLWCGTWTLDKSCSEKYENILKDAGKDVDIWKRERWKAETIWSNYDMMADDITQIVFKGNPWKSSVFARRLGGWSVISARSLWLWHVLPAAGHGCELFDPKGCRCEDVTFSGVQDVCYRVRSCGIFGVIFLFISFFSACETVNLFGTWPRSVLVISKSSSHVTFIVKNLVTVEDVLPVDGTWVYKPVPPAGRMKGEMYFGCKHFWWSS